MNKTMVSAIITTHNRVDVLPRAIDSVLSQTYEDMELIVVSDGSTDATDEWVARYADNPKFRYISYHPGRGGNYARNRGIKAARGEYVAFLDDDDEWLPEKSQQQVDKFQTDPDLVLVYTGRNILYTREHKSYGHVPHSEGDMAHDILFGNKIGTTSSVMVKKSVVSEVGMFDESLKALQDHDLWIRICRKGPVGVVPEPLLNYYNSTEAHQVTDRTDAYLESKRYIRQKYDSLYSAFSERERKSLFVADCMDLAMRYIRTGNRRMARKYIIRAFAKRANVKTALFYLSSFLPFKTILSLRKHKRHSR